MRHFQIDLTLDDEIAYIRTAIYLEDVVSQDQFEMDVFLKEGGCGFVACGAGHAATLPGMEIKDCEGYFTYTDRVFGLDLTMRSWCFDEDWSLVDNTPQGVAKRIRYALLRGVPCNFRSQMSGEVELCY